MWTSKKNLSRKPARRRGPSSYRRLVVVASLLRTAARPASDTLELLANTLSTCCPVTRTMAGEGDRYTRQVEAQVGAALFCDFLLVTMVIPIVPAHVASRRAGLLFAAKPLAQVVCNPLVAALLPHERGSRVALRGGVILGALGAAAFGVGRAYQHLLAIRALQGAASAAIMTGGMSLLLASCDSDARRTLAASRALFGLTLGVSIGPVFGGAAHDLLGRTAPFMLVAAAMGLIAAWQTFSRASTSSARLSAASSLHRRRDAGAMASAHLDDTGALLPNRSVDASSIETQALRSRDDNTPLATSTARAVWLDPSVLSVAAAMLVVSAQVGALEASVTYGLARLGFTSSLSIGMLWGGTVPTVHAASTCAIGVINARLRGGRGLPQRLWIVIGLALPICGMALIGSALFAAPGSVPRKHAPSGVIAGNAGKLGPSSLSASGAASGAASSPWRGTWASGSNDSGAAAVPLQVVLCSLGLVLQGACLGCVVTMVQPLLAQLAERRGDASVTPLLALSDSAQSMGFIIGPIAGAANAHRMGMLTAANALASVAVLLPNLYLHLHRQ